MAMTDLSKATESELAKRLVKIGRNLGGTTEEMAIKAGYRELAKTMHPDAGGTTAGMGRLNRVRDRLLSATTLDGLRDKVRILKKARARLYSRCRKAKARLDALAVIKKYLELGEYERVHGILSHELGGWGKEYRDIDKQYEDAQKRLHGADMAKLGEGLWRMQEEMRAAQAKAAEER
jgi:hypothetical protein